MDKFIVLTVRKFVHPDMGAYRGIRCITEVCGNSLLIILSFSMKKLNHQLRIYSFKILEQNCSYYPLTYKITTASVVETHFHSCYWLFAFFLFFVLNQLHWAFVIIFSKNHFLPILILFIEVSHLMTISLIAVLYFLLFFLSGGSYFSDCFLTSCDRWYFTH